MNKRLKISVPLMALLLTSCGTKHYDPKDYFLELPWKDDFRILQLNDIHIGLKDDQELQFEFLDLTINSEQAKPDLIVINGDLFTFGNRATAKRTFKWLDSHEIPWTVTWGNHDEQCTYSIDWVTGYLNDLNEKRENSSSSAKPESYCVFKDLQDDDIMGNANFAINLMKDGKVKEQVIIMDSNRYNFGDYQGENQDYEPYTYYDAFHEEQVDWYKDIVNYTTEKNDGTPVPSVSFFHIPLPEFQTAYDLFQSGSSEVEEIVKQNPNTKEGIACPKINTGMFDAMINGHSTNGVFVAHDHKNNWALKYKGITLSFGVNSSDRVYLSKDLLGGQVVEIHDDGSFDIEQIFQNYDDYKELND